MKFTSSRLLLSGSKILLSFIAVLYFDRLLCLSQSGVRKGWVIIWMIIALSVSVKISDYWNRLLFIVYWCWILAGQKCNRFSLIQLFTVWLKIFYKIDRCFTFALITGTGGFHYTSAIHGFCIKNRFFKRYKKEQLVNSWNICAANTQW